MNNNIKQNYIQKQENFNGGDVGCLFIAALLIMGLMFSLYSCKMKKLKEINELNGYNQKLKKQKSTLTNNVKKIKEIKVTIEKTEDEKEIKILKEDIKSLDNEIKTSMEKQKNLISEKNLLLSEESTWKQKYEDLYNLVSKKKEYMDFSKKLEPPQRKQRKK